MKEARSRYEALLSARDAGLAREGEAPMEPEIVWQSRWYAGEFGTEFVSTDGRKVVVRDFGDWNHGAGPDFQRCLVEVDGERIFGDVEMDLRARDWEAHGHAENADFDDVALHVCAVDTAMTWFTRTSRNRHVPRVRLVRPELDQAAPPGRPLSRPGLCSEPLRDMAGADILSLLETAARWRLERKAARLKAWSAARGKKQALHQGVAEALGYRGNELPMRMLAQIFPLSLVREAGDKTEAALFGMAGFLEKKPYDSLPGDAREHARKLWDTWWRERYAREPAVPLPWSKRPVRPANHPQRRVAALAALGVAWDAFYSRAGKFRSAADWLTGLRHEFWSRRHTLSSGETGREMALIGGARAGDIVVNVLIPFASLERDVWAEYLAWPGGADSDALKRARTRLFGLRSDAGRFTKRAWQQQGALQLYADFCLRDESGCEDCLFPHQLAQWQALPVDKPS